LKYLSLDGKMIWKWILNKLVGNSCKGEVEGFCESGYEPLCPVNCGEFDKLGTVSVSRRILLHGVSYRRYPNNAGN